MSAADDPRVRFPFGETGLGPVDDPLDDDDIDASDLAPVPPALDRRPPAPRGLEGVDDLDASDLAPIPPALDRPRDRGLIPLLRTGGSSGSRRGLVDPQSDERPRSLSDTQELELPVNPLERAALREQRELFESAGETPIVLDEEEEPAAPAAAPAPRALPEEPRELRPTPVERLAGLWRGDLLWVLLSVGGALLGPALLVAGWDYYGLADPQRPGHPWDRTLGSGGGLGLLFGVAGSALFLLNLTYVLRRRLGLLREWVSLRLWLNLHFVCGLTGGSLILVHSALNAANLVARISAASIAAAIASGLFGRYVLAHLPRRTGGEAADRPELAVHLARLRARLRARLAAHPELLEAAREALAGHRRDALSQVSQADGRVDEDARLGLGFALPLLLEDLRAFGRNRALARRLRRLAAEAGGEAPALVEETLELVRLHGRLDRRLAQLPAMQDLMDTWRALHMILALILVVTMALHVTIALTYSRLQVLGG